jgi:hypothetical protein
MVTLRVMVLAKTYYTMVGLRSSFPLPIAFDIVFCHLPKKDTGGGFHAGYAADTQGVLCRFQGLAYLSA